MKKSKFMYALALILAMVFGVTASAADYSGYYVGIKAEQTGWSFFNDAKKVETQPDASGIATFTLTNIGEWFMVKIWDGSHNTYLFQSELKAGEFITPQTQVDGNEPGNSMHVPTALRSGKIEITVDCAKKQVKVDAPGATGGQPQTPDTPSTKTTYTVNYTNDSNWANVSAHFYNLVGGETAWPGVAMTKKGDVWTVSVELDFVPTKVIFTDGVANGAQETASFDFENGATYSSKGNVEGGNDTPVDPTAPATVYWDNSAQKWEAPHIHYWGPGVGSKFPGVAMTNVEGDVWSYTLPAGVTGFNCNFGEGAGYDVPFSQTGDLAPVNGHIYNMDGDQGEYKGGVTPPTPGDYPEHLYLIGNVNGKNWETAEAEHHHAHDGQGVYTWNNVTFHAVDDNTHAYFTFITALGADWDEVNGADRFGAATENEEYLGSSTIVKYPVNVSAAGANSWCVLPGTYNVTADLKTMTLTLAPAGATEGDLNGDGEVDSSDLAAVINIITGLGADSPEADINGDGEVDSSDLAAIINIITGTK